MDRSFTEHGFLPETDPLQEFGHESPLAVLDEIGRDLPSLLQDSGFRERARKFEIPPWTEPDDPAATIPGLRLRYVRLGFLASAYINQVGEPPVSLLPRNLAVPLCDVCRRLARPPILSYDGYALYNWKRFDRSKPIALGTIDTIQNFVHLYDEHWFILVHVEIEQIAAQLLSGIDLAARGSRVGGRGGRHSGAGPGRKQRETTDCRPPPHPRKDGPGPVLQNVPTVHPLLRTCGLRGGRCQADGLPRRDRAQSSIMPTLVALMKIPHRPSLLTNHLAEMQNFMPQEHRRLIAEVQRLGDLRPLAEKDVYNEVLEAMATFREVHYGWANEYINQRVSDPRGTGGTPYMQWLAQLIAETRAHKIP